MLFYINDTLRVEGRLHTNGEAGSSGAGGGAGGSLLIYAFHLDGSGSIESNGGDGMFVLYRVSHEKQNPFSWIYHVITKIFSEEL